MRCAHTAVEMMSDQHTSTGKALEMNDDDEDNDGFTKSSYGMAIGLALLCSDQIKRGCKVEIC